MFAYIIIYFNVTFFSAVQVYSGLPAKLLKEEQKHVSITHTGIYSSRSWWIVFPIRRRWCCTALCSFQKRDRVRNYPTAAPLATVSQLGFCVLVFVCQEAWNVALLQTPETIWNANLFTCLSVYSVKRTDGVSERWRRSLAPTIGAGSSARARAAGRSPSCDLWTVLCINEQRERSASFPLSLPHRVLALAQPCMPKNRQALVFPALYLTELGQRDAAIFGEDAHEMTFHFTRLNPNRVFRLISIYLFDACIVNNWIFHTPPEIRSV